MWETIATIISVLGGFEAVKYLLNRKQERRIAVAEAESAEFHHLQETNEWLQKQLQAKEERFAEQTTLVRKLNTETLELTRKMAERDIAHERETADMRVELAKVRCDDETCPFRRPPNAMTPPQPGMTKEEYFLTREVKE